MTQTIDLPLPATRTSEQKLVGGVCFGHLVSHYYIMLLAPLFLFVREEYAVTYTELGLAFTAFNVVSTVVQTPTGFLVDKVNARIVIICGLLLGAVAFTVAGLVHSYWVFVAMFGVAGLANTVYHPADYALLSKYVPHERTGRAFSFHTFSGMIGNAIAPPTLLFMTALFGWRGAFVGAAALGVVAAIVLMLVREPELAKPAAKAQKSEGAAAPLDGWQLLMSAPILLNLVFFILLSFCGGGLNNYLVVSLVGALRDAGRDRELGAHRAPDHERGRRAGRRRAHRLDLAPRPRRQRRAAGDRDRLHAGRASSISTRSHWCC